MSRAKKIADEQVNGKTANELLSDLLRDDPKVRKSLAKSLRQARNGQFANLSKIKCCKK